MNIGIDGYEANTHKRVGIGQYAYQVLTQFENIDQKNSYTIFLPTPPLSDMPKERNNWSYVVGRPGAFWTVGALPRLIKNSRLDIFFSPTHYAPWFTNIPRFISVMDVSYLHFPEMFRSKDLLQLKYMGGYSIRRAEKIFTISEFSKNEIIKNYHKRNDDVVVTYPGVSVSAQPKSPAREKPYVLFVGTIQPRKNIERLVKAFEMLHEDVELLIVGKKGWLYEPIIRIIGNSSKSIHIKHLDFVTDEELVGFYKEARCLILPSLYEGFGLPVVEAMSVGCPVVVSNTTSLPEVAGEAGIYINPLDTGDIAKGLSKALQLSKDERKKLVDKGKIQAQKFSWENCAQKTLEVLTNSSLREG